MASREATYALLARLHSQEMEAQAGELVALQDEAIRLEDERAALEASRRESACVTMIEAMPYRAHFLSMMRRESQRISDELDTLAERIETQRDQVLARYRDARSSEALERDARAQTRRDRDRRAQGAGRRMRSTRRSCCAACAPADDPPEHHPKDLHKRRPDRSVYGRAALRGLRWQGLPGGRWSRSLDASCFARRLIRGPLWIRVIAVDIHELHWCGGGHVPTGSVHRKARMNSTFAPECSPRS
ncbi:hypothetical protein OCH239_10465 [Roseivivax halodurans JCM 10272]|uniref:Flagellar FliJ protein n=1 Tax=Roseivivax halodurans JCM 10272 TaxID=1449350 RepID=X7EE06_9RHOB|nr:hypothetical protein [Roseivivax halodurans]ETX13396.1 hypothetical protein OCH239_10465 [Roseivivax halodurans JCM 10272]